MLQYAYECVGLLVCVIMCEGSKYVLYACVYAHTHTRVRMHVRLRAFVRVCRCEVYAHTYWRSDILFDLSLIISHATGACSGEACAAEPQVARGHRISSGNDCICIYVYIYRYIYMLLHM